METGEACVGTSRKETDHGRSVLAFRLDTRGSAELTALYDRQCRTRVLGLFWISGVLALAAVGVMHALMVWSPNDGKLWGLLGGIGGTAIGIVGGIFGIWMTVERGKIAKLKARLEKEQSVPQ